MQALNPGNAPRDPVAVTRILANARANGQFVTRRVRFNGPSRIHVTHTWFRNYKHHIITVYPRGYWSYKTYDLFNGHVQYIRRVSR